MHVIKNAIHIISNQECRNVIHVHQISSSRWFLAGTNGVSEAPRVASLDNVFYHYCIVMGLWKSKLCYLLLCLACLSALPGILSVTFTSLQRLGGG